MNYLLVVLITSMSYTFHYVHTVETIRFTSAVQCEEAAKKIKDVVNLGKEVKTTCISLESK